ncbi:MAG: hypothetical protein ACI8P0_001003 [Planctomycetaceae bacterium]|jgi:hypothetical protein
MYFSGKLAVDPNDLTEIVKLPPTKAFFKLAEELSQGLNDRTAERETFAAVTILQRLNMAMRAVGVTNIIHLSKDGVPVYDDREGVDDDFKQAIIAFGQQAVGGERREFEVLTLALEDSGELLDYLIEIEISSLHRVGEFPIQLTINGVLRAFAAEDGDLSEDSQNRLAELMKDQQWHDDVQFTAEQEFEGFLDRLDSACQTHLCADRLSRSSKTKVLHAGVNRKSRDYGADSDPVFYDDYHWNDRSGYLWYWSDSSRTHECRLSNCEVVDENGQILAECGSGGAVIDSDGVIQSVDDCSEDDVEEVDIASEEISDDVVESEIEVAAASIASVDDVASKSESAASGSESSGGWLSSFFGLGNSGGGDSGGGGWFGAGDGDSGGDGGGDGGGGGGGCGGCGGGD